MRIVNLPRFIISMIIIVCILSFITSMLTTKVFSATPIQYENIVVSEGDTLWSIANNIGGNVNKNIYEIKRINRLESSMIYIGQELQIPKGSKILKP
jgi:LysM repeat protein